MKLRLMGRNPAGTFALLVTLAALVGCDGRIVRYTTPFNVTTNVQIRQSGIFVEGENVNLQTFGDILDDIPAGAIIERVTITELGADLSVLPSTTAQTIHLEFAASENGAPLEGLSITDTIDVATATLALAFLPDSKKNAALTRIRNRINANLADGNQMAPIALGLAGNVIGGQFDANATIRMKVTVTYIVCESTGSMLVASESSECEATSL